MDTLLHHLDPLFVALRPYITPYTAQLPTSISTPLTQLLTPDCYRVLLLDLDPTSSPHCVQLALSKAIGIAIVTASTIIKVPQLLKLINSGSSRGLSFSSYALETAGYLISLAYNLRAGNPLSTYGELGLIAAQNVAIAVLILHYGGRATIAAAVLVPAVAAMMYVLFAVVDQEVMGWLQAATIPLALASKVPQIVEVARNGGTGQLSAFAVFNYLFGSLARVFTTLAEVDDPLILYGFVGGAVLNLVLAAQMVWYWNSGSGKKVVQKKRYTGPKKGTPKRA